MYTEQLRELVPPTSQNTVAVCNEITLLFFTILILGWQTCLKSVFKVMEILRGTYLQTGEDNDFDLKLSSGCK